MKLSLLSLFLLQVSLTSCGERSEKEMYKKMENLPNTVFYLGAKQSKAISKLPAVLQTGLKNGMRCEAKQDDMATVLADIFYTNGASDLPDDKKATYKKELTDNYGVDCVNKPTASKAAICACDDTSFMAYCIVLAEAEKIETEMGGAAADCGALDRLKSKGTGVLGAQYDYASAEKNQKIFNQVFDSEVEQALAALLLFGGALCDSLNPEVETAVKDLMKLDFKYAFVEIALGAIVYGAAAKEAAEKHQPFDHSKVCETDDYKTGFGLCICKSDVGIQFCFFKAIAEEFKKSGYLDCSGVSLTNKEPKLDAAKKPSSLPVMVKGRGKKSAAAAVAAATALLAPLAAVLIR